MEQSTQGGNKFLVPEDVDDNGFSLGDMMDPRSKYSPQQKAQAVAAMVIWGDSKTASEKCGIPDGTLRWWKAEALWWPGVEARFKREKNDVLDSGYTRALHGLQDYINKVISEGEILLDKNGNVVCDTNGNPCRKMPGFKDAVVAMAIMQDKRALVRGEPTAISSKSAMDITADLFEQFVKLSDKIRNEKKPKVIEGEILERGKK